MSCRTLRRTIEMLPFYPSIFTKFTKTPIANIVKSSYCLFIRKIDALKYFLSEWNDGIWQYV